MITELDANISNSSENIFKINNSIISNLNNLIIRNNLIFDNDFPSLIEKYYKDLPFLDCKRISLKSPKKNNQNIIDMNENSFNYYLNEKIKKEFDLIKNLKNNNKKLIFDINKNYSKNKDNNLFNSRYKIENSNSIFINKSFSNANYLKNSIINKDNNNFSKENNNNLKEKDNLGNEIKIRKNNKMVYMNKCLIKQKSKNNDGIVGKKRRKSIYRGVSRNGNGWQVIISSKHRKGYIGIFKTQEIAARIYDIVSIKDRGIKAKTNFQYDIHQIQNIIETNIDYNTQNIEEIISNLIQK